jgi:glycerol-3-phosphate acyltransferase PlsY
MVAAVAAPVVYLLADGTLWYMDARVAVAIAIMSGLLVWRHTENISRLVKGTESKLGKKKDSAQVKLHEANATPHQAKAHGRHRSRGHDKHPDKQTDKQTDKH